LTFSQSSPTIAVGQVTSITVNGGTGAYYVSSNSAPNVAQINLVGNSITIFGNSTGSATVNICASSGGCGFIIATVSVTGASASVTLSQTNLTLASGQTATVSIAGGATPYTQISSNSAVVLASMSGNILTVTGENAGSATVNVCSYGGNPCAVLWVTVGGSSAGTVSNGGSLMVTEVLSVGQGVNLLISGDQTPYYLSSNTGANFSATLQNGNILMLTGVSAGSGSVNVCASSGVCVPVYVTVVNVSAPASSVSSGSTVGDGYKFYNPLVIGDSGSGVTELQKRLTVEGVYSGPINGNFGPLTQAAVKKYQSIHGLDQLGNVGPATRAALNQ